MRKAEVKVEQVPLASLKAYDGNAKLHNNRNVEAIAKSIEEFGFRNPVIAWHNEDGVPEIVAGHGRAAAAKRLRIETVPVVFVDDLSDAQRRMLTLADNQTTLMTGWDEAQLAEELDALSDAFDVEGFGFDVAEDEGLGNASVEPVERFATEIDECSQYVLVKIDNETDWLRAQTVLGLGPGERWHTSADGTGGGDKRINHVITWDRLSEVIAVG
nr:MAG TPA: ParB protein [Caudoviricetes sp.]